MNSYVKRTIIDVSLTYFLVLNQPQEFFSDAIFSFSRPGDPQCVYAIFVVIKAKQDCTQACYINVKLFSDTVLLAHRLHHGIRLHDAPQYCNIAPLFRGCIIRDYVGVTVLYIHYNVTRSLKVGRVYSGTSVNGHSQQRTSTV